MKSFALLLLAAIAASEPTIYLIRHGEKPAAGGVGLSPDGEKRAECLRNVFGKGTEYDIEYIMAQKYKKSGKRARPYLTVKPLADDLDIEVDVSCDRDDEKCVAKAINSYDGEGNVLICWQHGQMNNIVKALGAQIDAYPKESWDLIWEVPPPYNNVTSITSQECPGLDDL